MQTYLPLYFLQTAGEVFVSHQGSQLPNGKVVPKNKCKI